MGKFPFNIPCHIESQTLETKASSNKSSQVDNPELDMPILMSKD